jgi:hypothetical protein
LIKSDEFERAEIRSISGWRSFMNKYINKPELLSPAGNMEKLKAALEYIHRNYTTVSCLKEVGKAAGSQVLTCPGCSKRFWTVPPTNI